MADYFWLLKVSRWCWHFKIPRFDYMPLDGSTLDISLPMQDEGRKGSTDPSAQSYVEAKTSQEAATAFELALMNGVDAIVTNVEMLHHVQDYLDKRQPGMWKVAIQTDSYVLFLGYQADP